MVGIDRGVTVAAALSTGELLHVPGLSRGEAVRLRVLQQRLARAQRGSNRRARTKPAIAKLKAIEAARRKDWVEKLSTGCRAPVRHDSDRSPRCAGHDAHCARNYRAARTPELPKNAGLTGASAAVVGVSSPLDCSTKPMAGSSRSRPPTRRNVARCAGTSLPETARAKRCSNAEPAPSDRATPSVNAARNIAAGRAVTARGDLGISRSTNREPQLRSPAA